MPVVSPFEPDAIKESGGLVRLSQALLKAQTRWPMLDGMQKSFRATLWFKKGLLDAEEAQRAAAEGDDLSPGAVDLLPLEDRYLDDGSVTHEDSRKFGLHSGHTNWMPRIDTVSLPGAVQEVTPLVRELQSGRRRAIAVIGATMAFVGTVVALYLM